MSKIMYMDEQYSGYDDPTKVDVAVPKITLNTSAASGTDDADLYAAITALGWQDVIE